MTLSQKAYKKDSAKVRISPTKYRAAFQPFHCRNWRLLTIPAKTSDVVPVLKQQLVGVDSHASNLNIQRRRVGYGHQI